MPKLLQRFIYDDDGEQMKEGSIVLINGEHERIVHFNSNGDIVFEGFDSKDIETVEYLRDDRFTGLEDSTILVEGEG